MKHPTMSVFAFIFIFLMKKLLYSSGIYYYIYNFLGDIYGDFCLLYFFFIVFLFHFLNNLLNFSHRLFWVYQSRLIILQYMFRRIF